jgi:hypothetical protein
MTLMSNLTETANCSLQDSDNYYNNLKDPSNKIFSKYVELIGNYISLFHETISIQDKVYYNYIFKNGLDTISHIFSILLLYTNNANLVFYYCQKSYYYYVEFINQIDNTNHSFLQLNGKDASLFAYKKSIFEVSQDKRKVFENNEPMNQIRQINCKKLGTIYNNLIFLYLKISNKNVNEIRIYLEGISRKLVELYGGRGLKEELKNNDDNDDIKEKLLTCEREYHKKLTIISHFIDYILIYSDTNIENIHFTIENNMKTYLDLILSKLRKIGKNANVSASASANINANTNANINININNRLFNKIIEYSPQKFVNLLIN